MFLSKEDILKIDWVLGEPCRHQHTDRHDLSVSQGTTAKIVRKPLKMKRETVHIFPEKELIMPTLLSPFSGLQSFEVMTPSSYSNPVVPCGSWPLQESHIRYLEYQLFTIRFITAAKLQWGGSKQGNNGMVGGSPWHAELYWRVDALGRLSSTASYYFWDEITLFS